MTIQRKPGILAKKQKKQVRYTTISDPYKSEEEKVILTMQWPPFLFQCWHCAYFVEQTGTQFVMCYTQFARLLYERVKEFWNLNMV